MKLAYDTRDGTKYAIKIMSLKDIRRESMEIQLRREIAIMKMMKHEHVVQLKEVLQTDRHIYVSKYPLYHILFF